MLHMTTPYSIFDFETNKIKKRSSVDCSCIMSDET